MKTVIQLLTLLAFVLLWRHAPKDPRAAVAVFLAIVAAHDMAVKGRKPKSSR